MKPLFFLTLFCLFLLAGCGDSRRLYFKKGELDYTANVSEAEAQRLGEVLLKYKYFTDVERVSVQLDRIENLYKVRLVVQDRYFKDSSKDDYLKQIGKEASDEAFNKKKLDIELCDFLFSPQRLISWSDINSENSDILPPGVEDELKALDDSIPELEK